MQRALALVLATLALLIGSVTAHAAATDERLDDARRVFETFSNLSEQAIPTWLLERAYGVVVIPKVIKGALIFGGRGGRGVMAVRNPDGTWSNPVFVTLAGANVGFQWGVQSTDLVLVCHRDPPGADSRRSRVADEQLSVVAKCSRKHECS